MLAVLCIKGTVVPEAYEAPIRTPYDTPVHSNPADDVNLPPR
jgi:hypothetical protein